MFLVGGFSASSTGQDWNTTVGGGTCNTFGFASGNAAQLLCVAGPGVIPSRILIASSTLTATRKVLEPGTLSLLVVGLVGSVLMRRKKIA